MASAASDSSVLIHLGAINQLDLLPVLFSEVVVPDAVWHEVVTQGKSRPVVNLIKAAASQGWLKVRTPTNAALVHYLDQHLHPGESAAIALALEMKADVLLMDETDGRAEARHLRLATKGVIGLLIEGKQTGRFTAVRPLLVQLVQTGFHLSPSFVSKILHEVGE